MKTMTGIIKVVIVSLLMWTVAGSGAVAGLLDAEGRLGKGKAVIDGKGPNCILITKHRFELPSDYIIVSRSSTITGIDGKPLSLKSLKVPCAVKLKVYYRSDKQRDPELISMKVLEYAENATEKFNLNKRTPE